MLDASEPYVLPVQQPAAGAAAFAKVDFPSTFATGSFTIRNDSTNGLKISAYTIDLATGIMPDVVFDPFGTAGDLAAKPFTPDQGTATVGLLSHQYLDPRDGGFNGLRILFDDFDPGETFQFSVDVDPTSIQGAAPPGPEDSGSISGFELSGATTTVTFGDGSSLSNQLFRTPFNDFAAETIMRGTPPPAPSIQLVGLPPMPTVVTAPVNTVQIFGPSGAKVRLMRLEGALHLTGVPNGGYDIDPFEINTALLFEEQTVTIGTGTTEVTVTLTKTHPEGGINYFFAVVVDPLGQTGLFSNVLIAKLNQLVPRELVFLDDTDSGESSLPEASIHDPSFQDPKSTEEIPVRTVPLSSPTVETGFSEARLWNQPAYRPHQHPMQWTTLLPPAAAQRAWIRPAMSSASSSVAHFLRYTRI